MTKKIFIETDRLIIRQWLDSDRSTFRELNGDPENMEFFPFTFNNEQSDEFIDKTIDYIDHHGFGLFAVEIKETSEFIGFIGLMRPTFQAHFTPCTEIGWRLHKRFWGHGYATEAASHVLDFAFHTLKLEEVVSFTSTFNLPSIKVMQRIGMVHDPNGDFDHPRVENGHKLKRHVLYRKRL